MSPSAPTPRLLVVDDEPDLRTIYELTLLREGYHVETAKDLAEARARLAAQAYDCVVTDMRLPDGLGLELVHEIAQRQAAVKIVVITAYGSTENAVEALKAGAFDYLTKPVDLKQFRSAIAAALASRSAPMPRHEAATATDQPAGPATPGTAPDLAAALALARIVGHSAVMVTVRQRIERVAPSMAPVLIQGESGTGKELVARALHACSHRASGPFVAVNCSATPAHLLEAEFFGVRQGGHPDGHDRPGYFQAAHGGTLFLDEIGELPLAMQAKLLRAIQERQVRPLGASQEEAVDVRFVSATHGDLAQAVSQGRFRQDLYYRVNVIEIRIPPLRERREDLPELAYALLHRLCQETGQAQPQLSEDALAWLRRQPLAGNVRELENILHRGLALCQHELLRPEDLSEPHSGLAAASGAPGAAPAAASGTPDSGRLAELRRYLDDTERRVLGTALQNCGEDPARAASRLGLSLHQLQYRLQRLEITYPTPRDEA